MRDRFRWRANGQAVEGFKTWLSPRWHKQVNVHHHFGVTILPAIMGHAKIPTEPTVSSVGISNLCACNLTSITCDRWDLVTKGEKDRCSSWALGAPPKQQQKLQQWKLGQCSSSVVFGRLPHLHVLFLVFVDTLESTRNETVFPVHRKLEHLSTISWLKAVIMWSSYDIGAHFKISWDLSTVLNFNPIHRYIYYIMKCIN